MMARNSGKKKNRFWAWLAFFVLVPSIALGVAQANLHNGGGVILVGDGTQPGSAPSGEPVLPKKPKQPEKPVNPNQSGQVKADNGTWKGHQLDNAAIIVDVGLHDMQLPKRATVIAVATAMQESRISILASKAVPGSEKYRHDAVDEDHDSIGIFQQRPSQGWCGPISHPDLNICMDPRLSARKFYQKLKTVPHWQDLPLTVAAQRVQKSCCPTYYADDEAGAQKVVDYVLAH